MKHSVHNRTFSGKNHQSNIAIRPNFAINFYSLPPLLPNSPPSRNNRYASQTAPHTDTRTQGQNLDKYADEHRRHLRKLNAVLGRDQKIVVSIRDKKLASSTLQCVHTDSQDAANFVKASVCRFPS